MTSDDLKRIFTGRTLFRLDTILLPRLVPVLYLGGLAALLLWAVTHLFDTFARTFGDGLWGLLEIIVYGALGWIVLRIVCEGLLVFYKANEGAAESVSRARISSTLLDEVRDAIQDIADEEDELDIQDLDIQDIEDMITPATDPAPDLGGVQPGRAVRRTARRSTPPNLY